jgi:hypothetical protein
MCREFDKWKLRVENVFPIPYSLKFEKNRSDYGDEWFVRITPCLVTTRMVTNFNIKYTPVIDRYIVSGQINNDVLLKLTQLMGDNNERF